MEPQAQPPLSDDETPWHGALELVRDPEVVETHAPWTVLEGRRSWSARAVGASLRLFRLTAFSLLFYTVFFHLSVVRGNSMAPGILDGDRILVEPWSYLMGEASRGDVIVLRYPLDPSVDYIKRVIGEPGDHVFLSGGHVWVNGEHLNEPYVADVDASSYAEAIVREGHVFVLGDNRPRSSDSREFGQVPMEYVRGRVDLRLWPPTRAGWVR